MCAGAVLSARLDRLVYGAADLRAGAAGSLWDVLRDGRWASRPKSSAGCWPGSAPARCASSSPGGAGPPTSVPPAASTSSPGPVLPVSPGPVLPVR